MSSSWSVVRYRAKDVAIVGVIAALVGFGLGQCSSKQSFDAGYRRAVAALENERAGASSQQAEYAAMTADEAAADAAAAAGAAASAVGFTPTPSYEGERRYSGENFRGMACTDDCSGHEAGYLWAEENGVTDPDECGGNSDSFVEGCIAWAEEN